jgi:hypothetical protein
MTNAHLPALEIRVVQNYLGKKHLKKQNSVAGGIPRHCGQDSDEGGQPMSAFIGIRSGSCGM